MSFWWRHQLNGNNKTKNVIWQGTHTQLSVYNFSYFWCCQSINLKLKGSYFIFSAFIFMPKFIMLRVIFSGAVFLWLHVFMVFARIKVTFDSIFIRIHPQKNVFLTNNWNDVQLIFSKGNIPYFFIYLFNV